MGRRTERVLFVNPSWDKRVSRKGRRINRAWPPLDLLNCAALLEGRGIEAALVDARADGTPPEEIARRAAGFDKVFVTSSPLDRWQCPNLELDLFFERVRLLKHHALYVMGAHGTHYPEIVLKNTGARAVIRGEPEWTVMDVCLSKPLSQITGLTYTVPSGPVSNPDRPLGDIRELPVPAFRLLNLDLYGYELLGDRFVLLEASRGCPFPCTFCMREMYGGRAYREKLPEQVGRDVRAALDAGAKSGYFIDLEFSLRKEYAHRLCGEMRPYAGRWKWCCQTRADSVDEELLKDMKDAGCALVHFGVETGSPRVMESIDKRITLEQIARGVDLAKRAGIEVACFFMLGFPGETDADREMTLDFAKRLDPTYASFHTASPYPGTPLHGGGDWGGRLYPETAAEGEEAVRLKRWEARAYRRYYLRPRFLLSALRRWDPGRAARQARLLWDML